MKNILIVVAHPKKDSFSFAMANRYKECSEDRGDNVDIIDLYRNEHQQPFFTYDDANNLSSNLAVEYYQEKITKADEIIFVFPYWWGSFPAILKNFFDWNLSRGFAFEYINSRPKGLLTDKSVKILTTTGAPNFIYTLTGANRRLKNMFREQIIEFCGMKLDGCYIFGGVDTNNKNIKKILDSIDKI
jgi:NAD(P)H dehydrogenase (quinone)